MREADKSAPRDPGGRGYCSNHRLLVGFNDLASRYPEIAKEWSPTKNGELSPDQVLFGSGKQVWWLGKCGHEWKTRVVDRTVGGAGCPFCSGSMGIRVVCIETGKVYANLTEACKDVGTHKASIVNCCKGRQQKAGGYHWKYYDSLRTEELSDPQKSPRENDYPLGKESIPKKAFCENKVKNMPDGKIGDDGDNEI